MGYNAIQDLTTEEKTLWDRVDELWNCCITGDQHGIENAIHPQYTGWDANSLVPHDRNDAIKSAIDKTAQLVEYNLFPLNITICEHQVGIVNYRYKASIQDQQKNIRAIKGRWTEVFFKKEKLWMLIGVHGDPEPGKVISSANIY